MEKSSKNNNRKIKIVKIKLTMNMKKLKSIFKMMLFLFPSLVIGNNVVVTGVTRGALPSSNVSLTLSWENSWNVAGLPSNHDAVWIFIKFRPCLETGAWSHALLSTTMADHTLGADLAFAQSISANDRFGVAGNHNTGAMVKRATIGNGNIVSQSVSLLIVGSNGPATWNPATLYDIKAFAIEMVQIPQAAFYLGDGASTNGFQINSGSTAAFTVTSEFPVGGISVYDPYVGQNAIPQNYPKGFDTFYCMKYEVSQGQYAEYLNTLSATLFTPRHNIASNNVSRLSMYFDVPTAQVKTDKSDRACNFISSTDLFTFLDWAALRPMTEIEYEKICRGPESVYFAPGTKYFTPGGYAWGNTNFVRADTITIMTENGTETVVDYGANINASTKVGAPCNGAFNFVGGDGGNYTTCLSGPMGCGIFARDLTTSREYTGGTFYGVMEMSGNIWETVINTHNATSRAYTGIWGDGVPSDVTGFNTTAWPAGTTGHGLRGGAFDSNLLYCRVSDRQFSSTIPARVANCGGRGVR